MPTAPSYLQSVDIEVGFLRRGHEIAEQFSADEMAKNFLQAFSGLVLSVGQILLFEFHGQNLKGVVKGFQVLDLPDSRGNSSYGVIMERTDITFMKAGDSAIKIKSSAKKSVRVSSSCYFLLTEMLFLGHLQMLSLRLISGSRTWELVV